jgi:hypothetical protein
MDDDATTITSNGATMTTTTTMLNSMFSSFQVEMAKVVEGMFKQFAANQGTEVILDRLLKLEQATVTATPSGTQTEQAMARILDRLDEDKRSNAKSSAEQSAVMSKILNRLDQSKKQSKQLQASINQVTETSNSRYEDAKIDKQLLKSITGSINFMKDRDKQTNKTLAYQKVLRANSPNQRLILALMYDNPSRVASPFSLYPTYISDVKPALPPSLNLRPWYAALLMHVPPCFPISFPVCPFPF